MLRRLREDGDKGTPEGGLLDVAGISEEVQSLIEEIKTEPEPATERKGVKAIRWIPAEGDFASE